ncbi:MAG: hypothetical protein JKY54_06515 [Flavobacteriales bacterium]|nr:hypothetical protein [Flavobacteriales bacterium]
MAEEEKSRGKLLGEALINEISLHYFSSSPKDNNLVLDVAGFLRKEVDFQEIGGKIPAKSSLEESVVCAEKISNVVHVCAADCEAGTKGTFYHIEHVDPFAVIKLNVIKLLDYLNFPGNEDVKAGFLQAKLDVSAKNFRKKGHPEETEEVKVDDYFGEKKGVLHCKHKLLREAYNNKKNLTVMCAACNLLKKDTDAKEWVKCGMGAKFVSDIEEKGNLQQGVLFSKIVSSVKGVETLPTVNIGGRDCSLANGKLLGEFINEWGNEQDHRQIVADAEVKIFDRHRSIIDDKLRSKGLSEKDKRLLKHVDGLLEVAVNYLGAEIKRAGSVSSSGSDDTNDFNRLKENFDKTVKSMMSFYSNNKTIKKRLNKPVLGLSLEETAELKEYYQGLVEKDFFSSENSKALDKLLSEFNDLETSKSSDKTITLNMLKKIIDDVAREYPSAEYRVAAAEQGRLDEKARADVSEQARLDEKTRADVSEQARLDEKTRADAAEAKADAAEQEKLDAEAKVEERIKRAREEGRAEARAGVVSSDSPPPGQPVGSLGAYSHHKSNSEDIKTGAMTPSSQQEVSLKADTDEPLDKKHRTQEP